MTSFSSLNTAVLGLNAAQRGMDVTGQNVVNANTPGYSRQRVSLSASGTSTSATFFTGSSAFFGGVTVDAVTRIRDAFLEGSRVAANARMSALTTQTSALASAEQLVAEPGETGLQQVLDDFFNAWQDLGNDPTDSGAGAAVIERGQAVADQLRFLADGVDARWTTGHDDLVNVVAQVNQAATDLAEVNEAVRRGAASGRPVNELLDQRDQLVDTLAKLIGATASAGDDGQVSVSVNGITLVSGTQAQQFTLSGATASGTATTDPPTITWGTITISVDSGEAAGLLAALRTDLPDMADQLDGVAVAMRDAVNAVHTAGFTLGGAAGGDFFSGSGASDLTVLVTDPDELAVADASGVVNGTNAQAIGDLSDDSRALAVLGSSGPSQLWRELTTDVGVRLQSLQRASTVQQAVVQTAQLAQQADSGVNLDEEMTSMLLWQRAYQASARVITTVDEMLDTLINRTGTVGR